MNLEELFCRTCLKLTPHEYFEPAIQDGIKVFDIYKCNVCGDKTIQHMREIQAEGYREGRGEEIN